MCSWRVWRRKTGRKKKGEKKILTIPKIPNYGSTRKYLKFRILRRCAFFAQ